MDTYLTPFGPTKLHVNPIFEIGPLEPRFSEWLVFEVRQMRVPTVCAGLFPSPTAFDTCPGGVPAPLAPGHACTPRVCAAGRLLWAKDGLKIA